MSKAMITTVWLATLVSETQGDNVKWAYDFLSNDMKGPADWGTTFPDCKGTKQSPIDLTNEVAEKTLEDLLFKCADFKGFTAENTQMAVKVTPTEGTCSLFPISNGKQISTKFMMDSFHFHAPSEHTVNGRRSDLELHFVHKSSAGELAVVGVLFDAKKDSHSSWLQTIWDAGLPEAPITPEKLPEYFLANKTFSHPTNSSSAIVPSLSVALDGGTYVTYSGSLTTPPCTEGVRWHVFTKPLGMAPAQLQAFRTAMRMTSESSTARPVLPLRVRVLYSNTPVQNVLPRSLTGANSTAALMGVVMLVMLGTAVVVLRRKRPTHQPMHNLPNEAIEVSTVGSSETE